MSNGPEQCCALEICCDAAAARAKVTEMLVPQGIYPQHVKILFDWMDEKGLIFAPVSLRPFVQEIVTKVKAHSADQHGG